MNENSAERRVMLMLAIRFKAGKLLSENGDHSAPRRNRCINNACDIELTRLIMQNAKTTSTASGQRVLKALRDAFFIS